jgi:hypothetical protein
MCKPMFALLALAISLFGTQSWAAPATCTSEGPASCTFSPGNTTGTYEFGNDGRLIVQFDTVLTTFTLTATVNHTIDALDPKVFPPGTVCVQYEFNSSQCDEYDFTGNAGGPNGVPVKNKDYKRLITITLEYQTIQSIHSPAFGHAPGDNATAVYSEDILTGYFQPPPPSPGLVPTLLPGDPVMIGKLPGLSSVAAFDEPLEETDCFVWVSPNEDQQFTVGQEIEVEFQLFNNTCPGSGDPIRDKDARLSFFTFVNGQPVFVPVGKDEGGTHFHFDHDEGVNEREVDTEGLQPGTYYITVFSNEFSPQTRKVVIQ